MDREDIRICPHIEYRNEIEARGEIYSQHLYAIRIYDIEIRAGGRGSREEEPGRYDQNGQFAHERTSSVLVG